jgi:type III pantothenate kinase
VDLGTATTFDVVDADGAYAGGVIAPGAMTSAQALFQKGARLARVEILEPERVVGRNTEESIQSGVYFGTVGSVDALVDRIKTEMGFPAGTPVVATGGPAGPGPSPPWTPRSP